MVKTQTKYLCDVCNSAFDEIKEAKKHEKIPLKGKILPVGLMYLDRVEDGYKSAFYTDHYVENGKTEHVRRIWPCRTNIILKNSFVDRYHNIGYLKVHDKPILTTGSNKIAIGIHGLQDSSLTTGLNNMSIGFNNYTIEVISQEWPCLYKNIGFLHACMHASIKKIDFYMKSEMVCKDKC